MADPRTVTLTRAEADLLRDLLRTLSRRTSDLYEAEEVARALTILARATPMEGD